MSKHVMIGCFALAAALALCPEAPGKDFEVLGIGGAGGIFNPAVSPYDPQLMLLSSDMTGCYRSADGGRTWTLIHVRHIGNGTSCRPFFLKDAILWKDRISRDQGVTWQPVADNPPWTGEVTQVAGLSAAPGRTVFFAGNKSGLWRSSDGGKTWEQPLAGACGAVLPLGAAVYAVSEGKLQRSDDEGKTWTGIAIPLQADHALDSLTGAAAPDGTVTLYATAWGVGVLQSRDGSKTWRVSQAWTDEHNDQNIVVMSNGQTKVAYACQSAHAGAVKVWRTADGGDSWQECFFMSGANANVEVTWVQSEMRWGYIITRNGLGVSPADPNLVMLATQGDFYVSRDGAKSWKPLVNQRVGTAEDGRLGRYKSIGIEVTTTWWYLFDPFDANRTYIAYTDMGFARSSDRGDTWTYSVKGCPWSNTFYHVEFDPDVNGRMYAACSGRHDIPYWTAVGGGANAGGVCVSEDHGVTWRPVQKGLPVTACTSLCIDPKSTKEKRTLYATFFEGGVFKSTDAGATWEKKSNGLGNPGNLHAFMVAVHPKSGEVFCSITGHRVNNTFPVAGGLWKSADGAETWTDVTKELRLHWACGFALDPRDPGVIYLAASTVPGSREGGVYKTTNGGATWTRILKDEDFAKSGLPGYVHANFLILHPKNPDYVYLGSDTHGLWMSPDAGKTWKRFENLPFGAASNVTFDPKDPSVMYVATHGGGVLRGNYLP